MTERKKKVTDKYVDTRIQISNICIYGTWVWSFIYNPRAQEAETSDPFNKLVS